MEYSYNIAKKILDFLDEDGINCTFCEEKGEILFSVNLGADDRFTHYKIKRINHEVSIMKSGFYWKIIMDLNVGATSRDTVLEFIDIINQKIANSYEGSFDLDYFEGVISYNLSVEFPNSIIPIEEIRRLRVVSEISVILIGNYFYDVVEGVKSPEKAAEEAFQKINYVIELNNKYKNPSSN